MRKYTGRTIEIEEVLTMCDECGAHLGHSRARGEASVCFQFGYGSPRDGDNGDTDFCGPCAEKVLTVLQAAFPNVNFIEPELGASDYSYDADQP